MSHVIHKQTLEPTVGTRTYTFSTKARAMSVGLDPAGALCLWYSTPRVGDQTHEGRVVVQYTGAEVPAGLRFVGTVTIPRTGLVVHVFTDLPAFN